MNKKQTLSFQTEVKQLLHLMIHSLYSNKEIFLRELVSNASDAIDKLRFAYIKNPELNHGLDLNIIIDFNQTNKTITISDNGIGMTYDEVIENIGTIAKSGTKSFLEKLSGDDKKDANLIGQFGVGFYSAFIVADHVELITRKAGNPEQEAVRWVSDGTGDYSIENTHKDTSGTTIILHLKDGNEDLLSDWHLRSLIRKYSDHINYPIKMYKEIVPDNTQSESNDNEAGANANADNSAVENNQTTETAPAEPVKELETVNKANALWTRNKNEINNEEYIEFYKHISHDYQDPLKWIHAKVEGAQEYTQLLYIPSKAPFDMYDQNRRYGVKLYIKRVFIMDDAEKLLPTYLRFVRGIIDSQNIPLNVSREILQSSKDIDAIRSGSTKKILSLIEDIAKNDLVAYANFWKEFGNVLKEGVIEDFANKERIAKLLRFNSTRNDNAVQDVSLEDYISRMKPNQDKIYYIAADTYNVAKNSPHLEIFKEKDIEVLLLTDRIDEWLVNHLSSFDNKNLVSVTSANLDFSKLDSNNDNKDNETKKDEENKAEDTQQYQDIIDKIKTALKDKIKDVKITSRLINSPSCLVVDNPMMSIHMERLLQQAGQMIPNSKAILEINPQHSLVKALQSTTDATKIDDLSHLLFEQAMLTEGMQLEDPVSFVQRMNRCLFK